MAALKVGLRRGWCWNSGRGLPFGERDPFRGPVANVCPLPRPWGRFQAYAALTLKVAAMQGIVQTVGSNNIQEKPTDCATMDPDHLVCWNFMCKAAGGRGQEGRKACGQATRAQPHGACLRALQRRGAVRRGW